MIEKQLYRKNVKVVTNVTQAEAIAIAAKLGARLTTAREEKELTKKGIDSEYFEDLKNYWMWTATFLKKQIDGSYDVYENGEKVGNCKLPDSGLVIEWNKPEKMKPFEEHKKGTETYWWLDETLDEIAVLRGRVWDHLGDRCFSLSADIAPSRSSSVGGFRLVRGLQRLRSDSAANSCDLKREKLMALLDWANAKLCFALDEDIYYPIKQELARKGVTHSLGMRKEDFKGEIERTLNEIKNKMAKN